MELSEKQFSLFLSRVLKIPGGCWLWQGGTRINGYARTKIKQKHILAHRLSFEIYKGEIPTGLVIDHLCRNRLCVNPDHLEAVSPKVNVQRGLKNYNFISSKPFLVCKNGHNLTDPLNINKGSNQNRCELCRKQYFHNYYETHKTISKL